MSAPADPAWNDRVWDEAAYAARRDHDIAAWRAATLAQGVHPGSEAVIARCIDRLSLIER